MARGLTSGRWKYLLWRAGLALRGIDAATIPREKLGLPASCLDFVSSPGPDLAWVLRQLSIPPGSSVLDIGCGKGIALITLAKFPFAHLAGCDLAGELLAIAEKNLARARIKGVRLFCCDARQADLDPYSHLYLFHPFEADILTGFLANLADSLARLPRRVTILYSNPDRASQAVLAAQPNFEKAAQLDYGIYSYFVYVNRFPPATNGTDVTKSN